MQRNFSTNALILSTSLCGESNRSVCILSPTEGIFYAILYGGPKSKLKSLVSPFNRGKIYLYHDEVKKSTKITDFDVEQFHLSFRESLFKSWSASLAAEIVVKTKAAGSHEECWNLVNGFLDGLELCKTDENSAKLGLVRFLWRYLGILGLQSEISLCADCEQYLVKSAISQGQFENQYNSRKIEKNEIKSDLDFEMSTNKSNYSSNYTKAYFSLKDVAFHCADCVSLNSETKNYLIPIGEESLNYLAAISNLSAKDSRSLKVSAKSFNEMKNLLFYLIELACGQKLKTIESGLGIL